ncbi:MAG TPA: hypothetical protein VKT82_01690 [Ktedonobacterales bacterium]|nr:hypothetical protein [Ktedonobacterales bacterium]
MSSKQRSELPPERGQPGTPPPVLLLTIGIDAAGHVCKREGFLRAGTQAQMETARHIDYLLDVLGREQDEQEWGHPILPLEAVTGWQQARMIKQLRQERKGHHEQ